MHISLIGLFSYTYFRYESHAQVVFSLSPYEENRITFSIENVMPTNPTKSRTSNSSEQIRIGPKVQFQFVPRDTEESECAWSGGCRGFRGCSILSRHWGMRRTSAHVPVRAQMQIRPANMTIIQRDTLSETTEALRTVVTFVTLLISRTEFLV